MRRGLIVAVMAGLVVAIVAVALDSFPVRPQPARYSFKGLDDPVGFVPEAASQVPVPPVVSYNADGTRTDCPVEGVDTTTYVYPQIGGADGTVTFLRKKLKDGCTDAIHFPLPSSPSFPVYSTVPVRMTIAHGYNNPFGYFDQGQLANWSAGTVAPPNAAAKINCGVATDKATQEASKTGDGTQVLVAKNNQTSCASEAFSQFYVPFLPNAKGGNGITDLDHSGLTENVVWATDEYIQIGNDPNFYAAQNHLFQFGWAFDPRNVGQAILWNNMDQSGANAVSQNNMLNVAPVKGNALLWSIRGQYFCNDPLNCTSKDFSKISTLAAGNPQNPFGDPTAWLQNGAFVVYNPMPGFQRNMLRELTPSGAFTVLNNTSGLFVRNDGTVEFPLDRNGAAFPVVTQTWDQNQQFVVVNQTNGAVSATNDSYPGDEVYYPGNTFLPGQAGVITKWFYYPWTALSPTGQYDPTYHGGTIKHVFDQRASDGWLGLKNDLMENVLAWNDGVANGQMNLDLVGGQARKPYMFGAGEQFGALDQVQKNKNTPFPPASGADLRHLVQLEHANSFHLWRVPNGEGAQMQQGKMYKASLFLMTDAAVGYVKIASVRWTFQANWGFANDTQPVIWSSNKGDGFGAWVQALEVNPDVVAGTNLPPGWVWIGNADGNGLGSLQFPNGNVSIKAIQSLWTVTNGIGGIDWNHQVSWNQPGSPTTPRANAAGQNAVRFQLSGNVGNTTTKFVIALEEVAGLGGPPPPPPDKCKCKCKKKGKGKHKDCDGCDCDQECERKGKCECECGDGCKGRDRGKGRDKDKDREDDRDREKGKDGDKDKGKEKDKDERDKDRDGEKDRDKDRGKDNGKDKDGGKDKDKDKGRGR